MYTIFMATPSFLNDGVMGKAGRPRPFWRLTAPRAVILAEASRPAFGGATGFGGNPEERAVLPLLLWILVHSPRYALANPRVTGSDEPSCCVHAQGG